MKCPGCGYFDSKVVDSRPTQDGASPSTGVLLKRKIQQQIPDNIEEILDFLQEKRSQIMDAIPNKKQRFAFYYTLSEICMTKNRSLTEEEFINLLEKETV